MAQGRKAYQPGRNGSYDKARSVRISDAVWETAKARAESEGMTMSRVLALLAEGYARRMVNTPRVQLVFPAQPGGAAQGEVK